jgi:hypothetical protein
MNPIYETYVVLSTFKVPPEYNGDPEIILEKGSVWEKNYILEKNTPNETWIMCANNINAHISVELMKSHFKNSFLVYQEKFSHLDPNGTYFGQVEPDETHTFSIIENGQEVEYKKINEYIDSEGKKYNAFKSLNPNKSTFNSYWEIDNIDDYENKEFVYFDDTQQLHDGYTLPCYLGEEPLEKCFIPSEPIKVPEYFIQYPKMLEVVDYCFRNKPLTSELQKVFDDYTSYKDHMDDCWQHPKDIAITEVKPIIKEQFKQSERDKIMDEINYETEMFRQELIKKRLKP